MYPPGANKEAAEIPEALKSDLGLANPPFYVRDVEQIFTQTGSFGLPFGFTPATVISPEATSPIALWSKTCPYLSKKTMQWSSSINKNPSYH